MSRAGVEDVHMEVVVHIMQSDKGEEGSKAVATVVYVVCA